GPMRTFVYEPGEGKPARRFPGLLLYSEIFQQTPPIRRLALQFAGHGFVVMVPEIYHEHEPAGTVLGYDDAGKEKGNAYKTATTLSSFDADASVVLDALGAHPACSGRLGSVGFCIGGHLAFRAALNPRVLATCCFYPTDLHTGAIGAGKNADTLARAAEIRGELRLVWGMQDPHIPREGRVLIQSALHASGARHTWHELEAQHAFMRDEGPRYDPSAARHGFALALELFQRVLG
ncbi:MAG: dienelactone hydrolase family protein, partial [Thermoanaerobaculia bacterium]